MIIKYLIRSIILVLLFMSCRNQSATDKSETRKFNAKSLSYAKGFTTEYSGSLTKLTVQNPWEQAKNIKFEYLLSDKPNNNKSVIKTPVQKVVCLSTTHCAFISSLGRQSTIKGLTNTLLVNDTFLTKQIKQNKTINVGNEQALNYETILSLKPDVIFAYGVGPEVQSLYQKFSEWGIPVVIVSEYLESTPLAKSEWIKFFGYFYDASSKADSIFNQVEQQYLNYKKIGSKITEKPMVMSSLPWKGVWYMPGGESFMANFIADAGGAYLYADNHQRESINLSIERVMLDGQKADIWIHTGMAGALSDIQNADERLTKLPPFNNHHVYNNNRRQNAYGGNDFWESGVMNPQLILWDLIRIFHPEVSADTSLYYYQKLN